MKPFAMNTWITSVNYDFFTWDHSKIFFYLTCMIIGSHIVFIPTPGQLKQVPVAHHLCWFFKASNSPIFLLYQWVYLHRIRPDCFPFQYLSTKNSVLLLDCKKELRRFFTFQDKPSLVYCHKIAGLNKSMGLDYDATELRLFIDWSTRSLKAVLVHDGNSFSSIPFGHSIQMKETHNSIDHLLFAVYYKEHKWLICGNLRWLA